MSLYVLPNGDAIDPRTISMVYTHEGRSAGNVYIPPDVHIKTASDSIRVLPFKTFEEACAARDKILKDLQKPSIFVICNNDQLLGYTTSEQEAYAEVARLQRDQRDDRFYYHTHEVPKLS